MNNEIHDLAAPYALNALDKAERDAFARHLNMCGDCQREVEALSHGAAQIAIASAETVPDSLKERVLAQVAADAEARAPRRSRRRVLMNWLAPVAAAATLLMALIVVIPNGSTSVDDVLAAEDRVDVTLMATEAYAGTSAIATVAWSPERAAAVVTFARLDPVDSDRVYELWVIEAGRATPAGLFLPDAGGMATLLLEADVPPGVAIGVTVEPLGGSDQPTGDILFLSEV